MSRINPDDVFPARNLPGEAEKWGRSIEDEVKKLREQQEITNQLLAGSNRFTASTSANLSDQIGDINTILGRLITTLPISVSTAGSFGVTTTYGIKNTVSIAAPPGYTKALVSVMGWVAALNDSISDDAYYAVISLDGVYGESNYRSGVRVSTTGSLSVALSKTITGVAAGQSLTIDISAKSGGYSWTSSGSNKASIQGFALFYN